MGMAEEQGYGLTSLKKHAEKLGLPLPTYSMEGDSLVLTIYRSKAAATLALGKDVMESLSKAEWAEVGNGLRLGRRRLRPSMPAPLRFPTGRR